MRTVNLITFDLIKKEYRITGNKGEKLNIIRSPTYWRYRENGFIKSVGEGMKILTIRIR